MRTVTIMFAAAAGLAALTANAEACSIRGTFCGYPSWAANAFEGPRGFRGPTSSLTNQFPKQTAGNTTRKRKK